MFALLPGEFQGAHPVGYDVLVVFGYFGVGDAADSGVAVT